MQRPNTFAGHYIERAAHLRQDAAWFAAALADARSGVVVLWQSRNLIGGSPPRAVLLPPAQIPEQLRNAEEMIWLGQWGDRNVFAVELLDGSTLQAGQETRFEDLRMVAASLPEFDAGVLSYARAMLAWRRNHLFCGTCGLRTVSAKGGHVRKCLNPDGPHETFPRTDPAIIVLVSDGERALLGRQAAWPAGRYSTVAGFVEPGESLEDAVKREVGEETGIEVDEIEYHSSQPWPFPSSLMLGFSAHAISSDIVLRDEELEDARWFTRADIASGWPKVPPSVSISYRLIEHWFDAGGGPRLRDVQGVNTWPSR